MFSVPDSFIVIDGRYILPSDYTCGGAGFCNSVNGDSAAANCTLDVVRQQTAIKGVVLCAGNQNITAESEDVELLVSYKFNTPLVQETPTSDLLPHNVLQEWLPHINAQTPSDDDRHSPPAYGSVVTTQQVNSVLTWLWRSSE